MTAPFGIERDPFLLHPEVRLVPCSIDNAREFDMVAGFQVQDFVAQRCMELHGFPAHRFTSTVACRFAQHWTLTATGSDAVWQPAVFTFTASAVKSPPSPIGPIPSLFTSREICCSGGHRIDREEQGFFCQSSGKVKGPADPDPDDDRGAGFSLGVEHRLDNKTFDTVNMRRQEHGDPRTVLRTRSLGEDGDGKRITGLHVDCRHSCAGIVSVLCRVSGSTTLGRSGTSFVARRTPSATAS